MVRTQLTRLPDGQRLYVEEHGEGPPLLLIQGLGYGLWAWDGLTTTLAQHWRTIVFDNRGAGRSSKPAGPYSIEQMAHDTAHLLRWLDASPAHVLGFSMGGYIAQMLALAHPDLVRSLVLVGTSPGGPGHVPVPPATLACWLASADLPADEYARATMRLSFSPGWTEAHPSRYAELLTRRVAHPTPPEAWRAQYAACDEFVAGSAPIERTTVPVLVLHGQRDRVVPFGNTAAFAKRLPDAQMVGLPGVGHLSYIEAPAAFLDAVQRFLRSVECTVRSVSRMHPGPDRAAR